MARQKQQQTAEQQLADLRSAFGDARQRERDVGATAQQTEQDLEQLRARRAEAFAGQDEVEAAKVGDRIVTVEQLLDGEMKDRVAGAALASRRAAAAVESFIAQSIDVLAAERAGGDREVAQAVENALRELLGAVRRWEGRSAEAVALSAVAPDGDPRGVPTLQLGDATRAARRALQSSIPRPSIVVTRPVGVRIADTDDPDDAVRAVAQARARGAYESLGS